MNNYYCMAVSSLLVHMLHCQLLCPDFIQQQTCRWPSICCGMSLSRFPSWLCGSMCSGSLSLFFTSGLQEDWWSENQPLLLTPAPCLPPSSVVTHAILISGTCLNDDILFCHILCDFMFTDCDTLINDDTCCHDTKSGRRDRRACVHYLWPSHLLPLVCLW